MCRAPVRAVCGMQHFFVYACVRACAGACRYVCSGWQVYGLFQHGKLKGSVMPSQEHLFKNASAIPHMLCAMTTQQNVYCIVF